MTARESKRFDGRCQNARGAQPGLGLVAAARRVGFGLPCPTRVAPPATRGGTAINGFLLRVPLLCSAGGGRFLPSAGRPGRAAPCGPPPTGPARCPGHGSRRGSTGRRACPDGPRRSAACHRPGRESGRARGVAGPGRAARPGALTWIAHRASRPVLRFLLWSPWGRENDCGRQDLPGVAAPAFPRPFFPCFGAHRFRRQSPTALRNFREVTWAGPPPAQARPAAPHALAPRNAATPAAPAATSPQRARSH